MEAWLRNAIGAPDQLRQRVAFALSEILVVSDRSALFGTPDGLAAYFDLLADHAFGNFRALIDSVTRSPAMGVYLSMLGNEKPQPARNVRPDENFARELMQLFTIGTVRLAMDGSVLRDADGVPLPTYDQSVVEGVAHALTGWTFAGSPSFTSPSGDFLRPMHAFPEFHDSGPKRLLDGVLLPAGLGPEEDLRRTLDNIFEHANVAPFISRQLIQKLVTANPSPAYVGRVARVFASDASGRRGNLAAVIRAILLDEEARGLATTDTGGKVNEPLLRMVALWRAYGARASGGHYRYAHPDGAFSQAPLRAASVFNFFRPDYAPPGEMRERGLVSPEMEITNELTMGTTQNQFSRAIYTRNSMANNLGDEDIVIDIGSELPFAHDPAALVDRAAERLLGGAISPRLRAAAIAMVGRVPPNAADFRVAEAIHFIATSPEFAILR